MREASQQPLVTVVMPVRNEAAFIQRSLGAVLSQDYPPEQMEVLVVDGLSSDGTGDFARSLQAAHPNLRVLANPGRIKSIGLNLAIERMRGDILIVVDGHCEIAPDYVRHCVAHLLRDGVDVVGGWLETVGETPQAGAIAAAMSSLFGVGDAAFRTVRGRTLLADTVPFPAYTREILQRAGPFDEELAADVDAEYSFRLNKLGAKILLAADVRSRYFSRATLRAVWKQYFRYGFWKVRLMQKHPLQMRPRHFAPPLWAASLLALGLWSLFNPLGQLGLALAAGAYAAANGAASAWTARRRGWRHLPWLPWAFATLHLAYGLGFLAGLAWFWNRWGDKIGKLPAAPRAPEPQPSPDL
jgi:glycosyltransferase involved in cell wall biosynthesis